MGLAVDKRSSVCYIKATNVTLEVWHMAEKSISAAELEIMRVLWAAEGPVNITEIRAALADTGWEASTIKTLVSRLVKKGEIVQEKRGVYYYSPKITREEYGSAEARRLAEKVYGGGLTKLVASFVEGGDFSDSEIDELREILDRAGRRGRG